jgi:hypothetical protein
MNDELPARSHSVINWNTTNKLVHYIYKHAYFAIILSVQTKIIENMDSQSNALYDNPSFSKYTLGEITFNARNSPKPIRKSPSGRKFVILPAERDESNTSPFLSPSSSFAKPRLHHSAKSLRTGDPSLTFSSPNMLIANPQLAHLVRSGSYIFNDNGSPRLFSDASSIRSLASIGLGSTDGRRMMIRKVPNSPSELLSYIHPPT